MPMMSSQALVQVNTARADPESLVPLPKQLEMQPPPANVPSTIADFHGAWVGTWGDDTAEWDGVSTAGWDNSGVQRPDMEGKGQTDRGEGELNDALKPTKVKGQFTPGGPVPSITLKGVSIKGQSKVDYEEAAAAAQSDAQSALSQEKVPRAYQGAVKDYFDDLKK